MRFYERQEPEPVWGLGYLHEEERINLLLPEDEERLEYEESAEKIILSLKDGKK